MRLSFNSATSWDAAILVRESQLCGKACLQTWILSLEVLKVAKRLRLKNEMVFIANGKCDAYDNLKPHKHTQKHCVFKISIHPALSIILFVIEAFEATRFDAVKCIHQTHSLASVFCRKCHWTSPSNSLWMTSALAQSDTKYAHPLITTFFPMKHTLLNFST